MSGVCQTQSYEGEAGLACEMAYSHHCKDSFIYSLDNNTIDIKFDFFNKNKV
ncbi:[NiFe] hydrogenase metallocenter assembly protein HypF [hydrothermal vent metagenome]|uniref:[NiFe] hydrogenase metallocenter assembly protein HypF n=1 Tax=hydrothermal vent metagenome TaxID=652676 RepID=A0A3B1E7H7_9ZZZZ